MYKRQVYDCAYVELGDPGIPHAVVPMQGLQDCDTQALFRLGRRLRHYKDCLLYTSR